ncbi:maleylacetoacetate isomerase [Pseudochelatococcus lubricantis]|uniref:maleylacetoacetate isomerase n=1 Tax=Pseudochelatococcus lubricantis TaxID=1538102 RepID=UPI0014217C53|nr:maleylacetoacetate isomerase [Pseudochelatococcus lubricantis]
MRFHGFFRSSSSYRCRIAFNLKRLSYAFVSTPLREGAHRTAAFRALNPQALVPALEDGGEVFTQSLAIIEWLDETHPTPPLLPADPATRAHVRAFAQVIACEVHPLQNLRVLDYLRQELGQDDAGVNRWLTRWIGEGLAACEALLSRRPESPFCFGEAPGLADICLVPQMFSADRFGIDTAAFPRLRAVRIACEALPAFAEAAPGRQPDAA